MGDELIQGVNDLHRQRQAQAGHDGINGVGNQQEVAALNARISELMRENHRLQTENEDVARLRANNEEINSALARERTTTRELSHANETLKCELNQLRQEKERITEEGEEIRRSATEALSSEGRLRAVMTNNRSTVAELKQAIGSVDAMLEEAKRELATKMHRERRDAHEKLHAAIEKQDENQLAEAIEVAMNAQVDDDDIIKGQLKLEELRNMTDEERAAKANR